MSTPYTLSGSTVLRDGRAELTYHELAEFMRYAVRRKLRKRGHVSDFFEELRTSGKADYGWTYTRLINGSHTHYVHVSATKSGEGYLVVCRGARAEYTVARVCRTIERNAERKKTHRLKSLSRKRRHLNRANEKKRKKLAESQARRADQPRTGKRWRNPAPAALSLARNERVTADEMLTRQFRKQYVFQNEAVSAVIAIFRVRGNWKYSAAQVVRHSFETSLRQSGGTFLKFSREGFTLRFDLVDGRWRGDITPLSISSTKDNRHPTYRRMRECFRERLGFLTDSERREKIEAAFALPQGVIVWGGVRYEGRIA